MNHSDRSCHSAPTPSAGHGHRHHSSAAAGHLPAPDEPVYMGLPHERYLRPKLYVAAALAVPVLALAMGEMLRPRAFHAWPAGLNGWLQLVLTTPVFFWAGALSLPRDHHECKFVIAGRWCCEPGCEGEYSGCPKCVPNDFGTMNRVLEVN